MSNNKKPIGTKLRRRGRPPLFTRDAALAAAQATFARKGYAAASLDDLSAAMGINRPSLYAAFHSKEALYQDALAVYVAAAGARLSVALEKDDIATALRSLYGAALELFVTADGEAVGCMLASTAVTEAINHEPIARQTRALMEEIDALVTRRIERAIASGELARGTRPKALARLVVGMLHSLALRTRAGASRRVLNEMAADWVHTLLAAHRGAVPPGTG